MKHYMKQYPVELMSRVLGVSRSGFYKYLRQSDEQAAQKDALVTEIKTVYENSYKTYGSPRIAQSLHNKGIAISKTSVARYMKQMGICVRNKSKYVHTTQSNHAYNVAENVLDRNFKAEAPNQVWVSDITYIPCGHGFVYLTVFLDLFDRAIVGWTLSDNMTAKDTTVAALTTAFRNRKLYSTNNHSLMIHSDRGVQYACHEFRDLIKQYQCTQSMSRKGNCWDNAVAESFFKTIKSERLDSLKINSFGMAYSTVFRYIEGWYNTVRIHSSLNGLSPMQFFYNNVVLLVA